MNYTLQVGDLVGVKYSPPDTLDDDNYIQVSYVDLGFGYGGGSIGIASEYSTIEFEQPSWAEVAQLGFIHLGNTTTYTLIPFDNSKLITTEQGLNSCGIDITVLGIIFTLIMITIILYFLGMYKYKRSNK